jgi:hypothetical protein
MRKIGLFGPKIPLVNMSQKLKIRTKLSKEERIIKSGGGKLNGNSRVLQIFKNYVANLE